jgi:hypothetical protein
MNLIICSTPYQILTAVNLRLASILNESTDLIVFDYALGIDKVCENIRISKLFHRVKYAPAKKCFERCTSGKITGFLWNSWYLVNQKKHTNVIGFDLKYEKIYYSFADPVVVILCTYLQKKYHNIKFVGFEDGLSDYYDKQSDYTQRYLSKLFHIPKEIYHRDKVYMYCPKLASDPDGEYELVQIPPQFMLPENRNLLNKIFDWNDQSIISERIIYFDQLPDYRVGITDNFNRTIANLLKKTFGENIIVKMHPRRTVNIYEQYGIKTYRQSSIPFEICCMNFNCDQKIFITNISSACFMPKMIFNEEATIIFLFKIFHKNNDKPVESFLKRFAESYSDKTKLLFPESVEELNSFINYEKNGKKNYR